MMRWCACTRMLNLKSLHAYMRKMKNKGSSPCSLVLMGQSLLLGIRMDHWQESYMRSLVWTIVVTVFTCLNVGQLMPTLFWTITDGKVYNTLEEENCNPFESARASLKKIQKRGLFCSLLFLALQSEQMHNTWKSSRQPKRACNCWCRLTHIIHTAFCIYAVRNLVGVMHVHWLLLWYSTWKRQKVDRDAHTNGCAPTCPVLARQSVPLSGVGRYFSLPLMTWNVSL